MKAAARRHGMLLTDAELDPQVIYKVNESIVTRFNVPHKESPGSRTKTCMHSKNVQNKKNRQGRSKKKIASTDG